jgi:hypothetical protein
VVGDPNAPIDCFYVYPTVSTDPPNSDMTADLPERGVVRSQLARSRRSAACTPLIDRRRRRTTRPAPR